jgi:spore cortex formation protein SpoVR/YcgB (stage V sporulation)
MNACQKAMMSEINTLMPSPEFLDHEEDDTEKLRNLVQYIGEENVEVLTLRDQILALMDKMERQNMSNNSLLGNRISDADVQDEKYSHQYRPVKRRIYPKKNPAPQKKPMVKTLEVASE